MYSKFSNADLLYKISVNTDKKAFGELFKRYHAKLISFALCYLPIYEEAEDVVSDVFVNLLKKRAELKEINNFDGYIYFSVKNLCLNRIKNNKRKESIFAPIDMGDVRTGEYIQPLEQLLCKELGEVIQGLVENLPQKRRLVYNMIKDDGLKISEVAKLLDIADKTVKKHLELAVKDLRLGIAEYLDTKGEGSKIIQLNSKVGSAILGFLFLGPEVHRILD